MDKNNKRIALVTGATGGLGTAMCKKLSEDGYRVVGNYRNAEKAQKWQAKLKEEGYDIDMVQGDVCDYESTGKMVSEVREKFGPIDVLVNNAGITRDKPFHKMNKDDWDAVISTNLTSVFN